MARANTRHGKAREGSCHPIGEFSRRHAAPGEQFDQYPLGFGARIGRPRSHYARGITITTGSVEDRAPSWGKKICRRDSRFEPPEPEVTVLRARDRTK